jgi:hypothetical protein
MREHEMNASGPAENRTQKVETIEHPGDRPNPQWWQALCGPPPEVPSSSDDSGWVMKQRNVLAPNERVRARTGSRLLPIKAEQ